MFGLMLTLLIIDALVMSVVVLLQAGQGGGLASLGGGGGTDSFVGGRQAVTILTKMTWWCGGIFMFLSLALSVLSAGRGPGDSAVQELLRNAPAPATAPAGVVPNLPIEGGQAPAPGATAPAQTPAPSQ